MVDCSLTEWSHWEKVVDNWPKWRKLICSTRERFIENRPDEKKKKEENEQGKEEVDKKTSNGLHFARFEIGSIIYWIVHSTLFLLPSE